MEDRRKDQPTRADSQVLDAAHSLHGSPRVANVLLCEINTAVATGTQRRLAAYGLATYVVSTVTEAIGYLRAFSCDAVVVRSELADGDPVSLLASALEVAPHARRIVFGASPSQAATNLAHAVLPLRHTLSDLLEALENRDDA